MKGLVSNQLQQFTMSTSNTAKCLDVTVQMTACYLLERHVRQDIS